jgi:hypothetical protein
MNNLWKGASDLRLRPWAWACGVGFCFIVLVLLFTGCGSRPLLSGVDVSPSTISPNADQVEDVTRIAYRLSRSADLSIYLVDAQGGRHYFRQSQRRSAGKYGVDFGGVVDGRMLPDGEYQLVVEATDEQGHVSQISRPLTLHDADVVLPELQNFSVYPQTFTPNQDGFDDRVAISYYLTKPADVRVFLVDSQGTRYPIAEKEGAAAPGEVGTHVYDYDAGIDQGATPPPNGIYTVQAEARDLVGNLTVVTGTLTIQEGGVPRVDIVQAAVDFEPKVVPIGQVLAFTLTVENIGSVPARTSGPPPGTLYTSGQNFNTLGYPQSPGAWRIGIDFEDNSSGRPYPYRWALASDDELTVINGEKYLMPGQRATVTGYIRITDKPPRNPPYFWAGLIHEDVRILLDHVDPQQIDIAY